MKILKFEGWKGKRIGEVEFFECPCCGYHSEIFYTDENGMVDCYKCKQKYPKDKIKSVTLKKPIVVCKVCNNEVSLTPIHLLNGYCYKCDCENLVAIKFRSRALRPQTVMRLNWNKEIKNRSMKIENSLFLSVCENKKDFLILRIMQLIAKKENVSFRQFIMNNQKAGLVFDITKERYVGYIIWSEGEKAILRQIFIINEDRRRGNATRLIDFWVKNFADKINEKYIVESPNKITQKILIKLDHAKPEGSGIRGIKCSFEWN